MSSLKKSIPLSPRLCVWRGRSQISKHRCLITAKNICKHRSKSLCWTIPWTNLPSVSSTFLLVCPVLKTPPWFYFSATAFSLSDLHWEHRVLATGPPGKSLPVFIFCINVLHTYYQNCGVFFWDFRHSLTQS